MPSPMKFTRTHRPTHAGDGENQRAASPPMPSRWTATAGKIWAAGHQHSVFKKSPDEPEAMDTDVFSDRFESTQDTGLSIYDGGVRAYDPDMNLTSERLTIKTVKGEHGQSNQPG